MLPRWMIVALALGLAPACSATGSGSGSEDSSEAESSSAESESESGPACTDINCSSLFTVHISHSFDFDAGPHQILVNTTEFELICSIDDNPTGNDSCFGNAYVDISWDESTATIVLTDPPFFDAVENPDAVPVEEAEVVVNRGGETVYQETLSVDAGDPIQPDPCGPVCWEATVDVDLSA